MVENSNVRSISKKDVLLALDQFGSALTECRKIIGAPDLEQQREQVQLCLELMAQGVAELKIAIESW